MARERGRFPVSTTAGPLGVSRSGYCARSARGGARADPPAGLKAAVEGVWEGSGGAFGFRRVAAELPPEWSAGPGRVRRAMREPGIGGCRPRSRRRTTVPDPDAPSRPDLVRRHSCPPVPTTVPCGDITYLRTGEGWPCLAAATGLSTRMVIGWRFSPATGADMVVSALEMAWGRGYVAGNAVFHADRGAQHAGKALADWARGHDVRLSVGRTGRWARRRRRGVVLGEPQERDVLPDVVPHEARGDGRVHRLDRGVLQPEAPPLGGRLQAPRRADGGVRGEDGGGVRARPLPGKRVSEILTHITLTYAR